MQADLNAGFSAAVLVPKLTDDLAADTLSVERELDAAWRGVSLENLDEVVKAERALRREQRDAYYR